jgi:tetratricopeptide (TPR) repeat protein
MFKSVSVLFALCCFFGSAFAQQAESDSVAEIQRLMASVVQLYGENRLDEALAPAKKAMDLSEKAVGPEHELFATALNNLAKIYVAKGKLDEAEKLYQRALKIYEKKLGVDHLRVADLVDNLAFIAQHYRQDLAKAEGLYKRSLTIREKSLGPEHEEVLLTLSNLIDVDMSKRDFKAAEPLLQRLVAATEKVYGSADLKLAEAMQTYAYLLRRGNREPEAKELESRLNTALLKSFAGKSPLQLPNEMIVCRAISLVVPEYPLFYTLAHVSIPVEILIDEDGKVIDARVAEGPTAFIQASVSAARSSRFIPLMSNGRGVKYSGTIVYDFRKYKSLPGTIDDQLRADIKSKRCIPASNFKL